MIDYGAYHLGCPVKYLGVGLSNPNLHYETNKPIAEGLLGHVVGYNLVEYDEGYSTILDVMWSDGRTTSVHPNNVERL